MVYIDYVIIGFFQGERDESSGLVKVSFVLVLVDSHIYVFLKKI